MAKQEKEQLLKKLKQDLEEVEAERNSSSAKQVITCPAKRRTNTRMRSLYCVSESKSWKMLYLYKLICFSFSECGK